VAGRRVDIVIPYIPRPLQRQIHNSLKRFNILVCHRRFGKTVCAINEIIKSASRCPHENPRFAYIAPFFNQAKTVAWDYAKYFTSVIPGVKVNESELRIDLPGGARISLYGADNPDRLRGMYLDGVVLDEYADMSPRLWSAVIRPALSDRQGWALFIGTPKGRNQFWEIYDQASRDNDWYAAIFKASQTGILSPDELSGARKHMSDDQYEQEFECSWQAALIGAYYGREINTLETKGRITMVPHEPSLPVYTAWDLGVDDATAIWFAQTVGPEVRVIDYYENSGCGLEHYAKLIKSKPYVYKEHFLPHDIKVVEYGTGRSRLETLQGYGLTATTLPNERIEDGINASRLLLQKCWFDLDATKRGVECLRQYQREFDDKLKTFKNRPRHDFSSHAADAFRYLAMGLPAATAPVQTYRDSQFFSSSPTSWMGR
jgi:hypothetical protein